MPTLAAPCRPCRVEQPVEEGFDDRPLEARAEIVDRRDSDSGQRPVSRRAVTSRSTAVLTPL